MANRTQDDHTNGIEIYPYRIDIRPMIEESENWNTTRPSTFSTTSRAREASELHDPNFESITTTSETPINKTNQTQAHLNEIDLDLKVLKVQNHTESKNTNAK